MQPHRRVRIHFFNPWAGSRTLEDLDTYLTNLPKIDLAAQVQDPKNADLLQMARLDCDWHGECTRCFGSLTHTDLEFLPARVVGLNSLMALAEAILIRPKDEEWWLCFMAQHPQKLENAAGPLLAFAHNNGIRILYYAFDEASRTMPCFKSIAPYLDVLVHDEYPLDPENSKPLNPDCQSVHRSWVANIVPFAAPFNEQPERKILFLGSRLGLTEHRSRQIKFLKKEFKDRFICHTDHSVSVADRFSLRRYQVGWSPEGIKFSTPAMSRSHTDRPFWSGCLGMVPLSENSRFRQAS